MPVKCPWLTFVLEIILFLPVATDYSVCHEKSCHYSDQKSYISSPSKSTTFQGFVYSNRITKDLHNWHCVKQSYLNGGSGENIIMIPPCMNYHATWFCVSVCREINCFNDSLVNTYELKCDFLWCGCANHLLTAGLLNNFSLKMDDGFGIALSNIHYV